MSETDDQNDRAPERDGAAENGTVTAPLTDLMPDERNANAGTERGRAMVENPCGGTAPGDRYSLTATATSSRAIRRTKPQLTSA
jgi:hypothetical protein